MPGSDIIGTLIPLNSRYTFDDIAKDVLQFSGSIIVIYDIKC